MNIEQEMAGDVCVVTVQAPSLDTGNSKAFKDQMTDILGGRQKVVIDLGQVEFVDSSGLGALLSCMRALSSAGGELRLANVNKAVRALFELVRFHRIVDVYNERAEAVAAFQG